MSLAQDIEAIKKDFDDLLKIQTTEPTVVKGTEPYMVGLANGLLIGKSLVDGSDPCPKFFDCKKDEAIKYLGEAWKDHPDPSGFMRAAHDPNNALLVWWYNPSTGAFIKSRTVGARHVDDLNNGNIPPHDIGDWVRGRVFEFGGKAYMIVYFMQKKKLPITSLQDIFDKAYNSVDKPITRVVDDNGDDLSSMFENFAYVVDSTSQSDWPNRVTNG
jgi:hypothetical protein